jgi:DNA invertase Pin-like site-specific DNA recombinase
MLIPYVRQSRARERTISLDEQLRSISAWAERAGVELAEPVIEQGVSGSKSWRARELGLAVRKCETGEADGIIVAWQDRLSRENGLATAEVWDALDRARARLVCAAEGLDTATGDHELIFTIKAGIARDQWKRFRENWENARRRSTEAGVAGKAHVPFAYEVGTDRRLVPVRKEADALRRAFAMRAQGASWSEIAAFLDATGLEPRQGWAKRREIQGKRRWIPNSVARLISNPVYLGHVRFGELVNEAAHEAIVTRGEWLAAQRKGPGRLCRSAEGTRLVGLIFCASCGKRMTPSASINAYRCLKRRHNGPECTASAYLRMDHGDAFVVAKFVERYGKALGALDDEADGTGEPDIEPLRRRLAHAEDAMQTLVDDPLSLAALPSRTRAELLRNAQDEVDDARKALDDALELRQTSVSQVLNSFDLGDIFESGDPSSNGTFRGRQSLDSGSVFALSVPDQRRLLAAGIARIDVAKGGRHDLENRVLITWTDEQDEVAG